MTDGQLSRLEERFRAYADRYRQDGVLEPMMQLKLEHTVRVAADCRAVASGEGWAPAEAAAAEAAGLFHDIARFPQFRQYRSFADAQTVDHGDLGADLLQREGLLAGLSAAESAPIACAVRFHNKKELPAGLPPEHERLLRLVRDADRLDIFFVCWDAVRTGHIHDHPEISLHMDFYGPPTETVMDQFERGEKIAYADMKTMTDRFVLQLSWMHDLTYPAALRLVRERGILDKFRDVLPVRTTRLLHCFDRTERFLAGA